jgi:serine/threonine protein kinase
MAAAHAARITHRDLKPLNIMVGADGRVRILDFGLAKQAVVSADPDETQAASHTQPGMILGTVNYMSPEQARGAPTDYRSDQFSFGLILYEMAAGKRAFERPESVQTMSAIIAEEAPPIEQNIPAPLRWVIDRCLAKDPADRYESSRDLFQNLRSLRDHASEASGMRTAAAPAAALRLRLPRGAASPGRLWRPFWQERRRFSLSTSCEAAPPCPISRPIASRRFPLHPEASTVRCGPPTAKPWPMRRAASDGPYETYIRYLDAATPVQVTHTPETPPRSPGLPTANGSY